MNRGGGEKIVQVLSVHIQKQKSDEKREEGRGRGEGKPRKRDMCCVSINSV